MLGIYNFVDGTLCHINFTNMVGNEINSIHLAVLFNIPAVNGLVLCIPLTSPKLKHFKNEQAYIERNYLETKFFRQHYIKQTDSIALLEQIKTISINRIENYYKDEDGRIVILSEKEKEILRKNAIKYLKYVLYK